MHGEGARAPLPRRFRPFQRKLSCGGKLRQGWPASSPLPHPARSPLSARAGASLGPGLFCPQPQEFDNQAGRLLLPREAVASSQLFHCPGSLGASVFGQGRLLRAGLRAWTAHGRRPQPSPRCPLPVAESQEAFTLRRQPLAPRVRPGRQRAAGPARTLGSLKFRSTEFHAGCTVEASPHGPFPQIFRRFTGSHRPAPPPRRLSLQAVRGRSELEGQRQALPSRAICSSSGSAARCEAARSRPGASSPSTCQIT